MGKPRKLRQVDGDVSIGFDMQTVILSFDQIMPLKAITEAARKSVKYKQIAVSIGEVGVIEPPVVSGKCLEDGRYMLLDGHLRVEVLRKMGKTEVTCLVSTDDESFTYNKQISRLSTIQEHRMIAKAVARGISEEKIAKALNVDVASIVRKKNLLKDICSEAVAMLKDKTVPAEVFNILRRMKPFRQVESAGLMNSAGTYATSYAQALLAATPKNQLADPEKPKKVKGLSDEQMVRMENEMANLQREFQLIEENYSADILNLTLAKGYLTALLGNAKVVRYLAQHHSEILSQFQKISEMTTLAGKNTEV
ncbi:MAG: chromosome partitioning protein ParB [Micavibrio sp.]|nr:MAG: chromosome partitioning protein ParB [Micavibrio sp.]